MSSQYRFTRKISLLSLVFALIFCVSSCAELRRLDKLDSQSNLTLSEVKNLLTKDLKTEKKKKEKLAESSSSTPIPKLTKLMLSPPPPAIGGDKMVSFSVTDQVPLKDVLIELGRVANIDVDIDPAISGGVIINAKNRPLKEVLDRISALAQLRYSYKNSVLHFERDAPYMKNYFVDYLSGGTVWSDVEANLASVLTAAAASSPGETVATEASVTTNKSAGIISIFATERQHVAVQKYLAEVEKYSSAQVLIEAKVVEVTLKDNYKTGIDWSFTAKLGYQNNGVVSQTGTNISDGAINLPIGSALKGIFGGNDIKGTMNALEEFGITKALSSPRIHAINNQKATISFVDKIVYFNVTNTQSQGTGQSSNVVTTATSTKVEESVGIQLDITPSINLKTGEITMDIRPELSSVSDYALDPVNKGNKVPIVNSRKVETQVKIQSGNVIVIGGLMKQDNSNQDRGVPFIQRVPFLGWLFKSVSKTSTIIETVIFIKATIIDSNTSPNKVDRELQENLDVNRRTFITQ